MTCSMSMAATTPTTKPLPKIGLSGEEESEVIGEDIAAGTQVAVRSGRKTWGKRKWGLSLF